MEHDYAAIRDRLAALQTAGPLPAVFGSEVHRFRLNPPLIVQEVAAFEAEHGVALPADYRGFLIHVANGGAGPAYGLFPLGATDCGHGQEQWRENDGFVGVLSQPFPHTGPWNDLSGRPVFDDEQQDDEAYEDEYHERLDAWERVYFRTANVNGAVPICHLGCAKRQWLVVTGQVAGHVWDDDRVDHLGLRPTAGVGRSFLGWYCDWLGAALRKAGRSG